MHQTMNPTERRRLVQALRGTAEGDVTLFMGPDTGFLGTDDPGIAPIARDDIPDDEVISAIRSAPTHY